MTALEIPLFIIAYSLLIVTIFMEVICYRRRIESLETIAFTGSLLLLVVSLTLSPLLPEYPFHTHKSTDIFTLLAMILVGLTTSLNVMEERQHQLGHSWKNGLFFSASTLFAGINVAYDRIKYTETHNDIKRVLVFGNRLEPGITFGWNIQPGKNQEALILRTNLRWYPLSSFRIDDKKFDFKQLEYNLIQVVFYPERLQKWKK